MAWVTSCSVIYYGLVEIIDPIDERHSKFLKEDYINFLKSVEWYSDIKQHDITFDKEED